MLKDPSASWMRAGVHYWLGFAAPILVAAAVRMAGAANPREGVNVIAFLFGVWGTGMMGSLLFGLLLLLLRSLRHCQPESRLLSAILGAHTAGLLLVAGATWEDGEGGAEIGDRSSTWFVLAMLVSAVLVHALAPRAEVRRRPRRRSLRQTATLSPAEGGMTFAVGITIILTACFVAFGGGDEVGLAARFLFSPVVALAAGFCGFVFALPFGMGAAIGYRMSSELRLRPWHCAVAAGGFALFFALFSLLAEMYGYPFGILLILGLLAVPFLFGLVATRRSGQRRSA